MQNVDWDSGPLAGVDDDEHLTIRPEAIRPEAIRPEGIRPENHLFADAPSSCPWRVFHVTRSGA